MATDDKVAVQTVLEELTKQTIVFKRIADAIEAHERTTQGIRNRIDTIIEKMED
ncbi:MAG: hypothetical protein IIA77_02560 [Proteobacteria bacterium]|nr:hypothetical protein [Pseudomonadota bacterium]